MGNCRRLLSTLTIQFASQVAFKHNRFHRISLKLLNKSSWVVKSVRLWEIRNQEIWSRMEIQNMREQREQSSTERESSRINVSKSAANALFAAQESQSLKARRSETNILYAKKHSFKIINKFGKHLSMLQESSKVRTHVSPREIDSNLHVTHISISRFSLQVANCWTTNFAWANDQTSPTLAMKNNPNTQQPKM